MADLSSDSQDIVDQKRLLFPWKKNPECRRALLILWKFYENDISDLARIFNRMFKEELLSAGFFKYGHKALKAQVLDPLLRETREYKEICIDLSFNKMLYHYGSMHARITETAESLGIVLIRGDRSQTSISQRKRNRQQRDTSIDSNTASSTPALYDSEEEQANINRSRKQTQHHLNNSHDNVLSLSSDRNSIPPILFRAFSSKSACLNGQQGFTAKAYPCSIMDEDLLEHASRHLSRQPWVISPLISTTSSFIWAMHIARRKHLDKETGVGVAVLKPAVIESTILPGDELVRAVIRAGKKKWEGRYKGAYEYLVWGQISSVAIVKVIWIQEFEGFLSQNPSIATLLQFDKIGSKRQLGAVRATLTVPSPDRHCTIMRSIGELLKYIKPNVFVRDPFIIPFVRVIVQNFRINSDPGFWEKDVELRRVLEETIYGCVFSADTKATNSQLAYISPPVTPQKALRDPESGGYPLPLVIDSSPEPDEPNKEHVMQKSRPSQEYEHFAPCWMFSPYQMQHLWKAG